MRFKWFIVSIQVKADLKITGTRFTDSPPNKITQQLRPFQKRVLTLILSKVIFFNCYWNQDCQNQYFLLL